MARDRVFLFLQGPHGPFFAGLAALLRAAGCETWRVGFNTGDRVFWHPSDRYIPYRGPADTWPERLAAILDEKGATDLVLYGDTRPVHASAIRLAEARGLTVHVFEEGYLRPYWTTYERGGSNGHSRLMGMSVADMRGALARSEADSAPPPASWGAMRQHIFYGALYHWFVLVLNRSYRGFRPHRDLGVATEFRLYLKRLLFMPVHAVSRALATRRVRRGRFPYHLALLQLDHDTSFRAHSPFASITEFVDEVVAGFAKGAPAHHHLVFKDHPLEDGRVDVRRALRRLAAEHGLDGRIHYLRGGKLAGLLDAARSVVTVNSTAAQQALWRGLPLKAFGRAVYSKPEFISDQPLHAFFAAPMAPDAQAYRDFRRYLLETSQVPGNFYSARGRNQLLRQVVDMVLSPEDPYDALVSGTAAPRQQLHLVR